MITSLLVKIKHRFPGLWRGVERVNGIVVRLRYGDVNTKADAVIAEAEGWSLVTEEDIPALSAFLLAIPEERKAHFDPHPFDIAGLRHIFRSGSFIMLIVREEGEIIGYHFLRLFATGTAFHGLTVAESHGGRGIGTRMWALGARIASALGMEMRATISEANLPSLASCRRGCDTRVLERLPGGYLLLKCKPKS